MFHGRNRRKTENALKNLNHTVQRIEEVLDKMNEHRVQVTIQNLHVNQASLEQLVFRLDKLDIDELSGSLNLGNNFGTDAVRQQKTTTRGMYREGAENAGQQDRPTDSPRNEAWPDGKSLSTTERGYQISMNL